MRQPSPRSKNGPASTLKMVYTVGYGGRRLVELLEIVKSLAVKTVVDVRRWTTSKKIPEFSGENLSRALEEIDVSYIWIPELGGYRRFGVDVEDHGVARCFESEGFRAYATYITMNPRVKPYLEKLLLVASSSTTILLCRERYPWLCHRKILSDYLYAKRFRVLHVIDRDTIVEHRLSKCAEIVNGELRYF